MERPIESCRPEGREGKSSEGLRGRRLRQGGHSRVLAVESIPGTAAADLASSEDLQSPHMSHAPSAE